MAEHNSPALREVRLQEALLEVQIQRRSRRRALLLVALFLIFGLLYSLVVPPFETPDEPFHYGFARHIAQGNGLPVQSEQATGPWAQEGSQAPLYYLLTGWLTRGIDQSDFAAIAVRNPRANIGDPLDPGNKNFMLYSGRQPPLVGSNLALHVGRWFSLLLGAITLWCVYLTVELAADGYAPGRRAPGYALALLATAFVAAIPQFLFISASFTNDTLVMAAAAVTVLWLARLLARPAPAPIRWWEWSVLGLLLGVAALSKLQGLGLLPLAGATVLWLAWRRRSQRLLLEAALFAGLPAVAVAGWWYARNILLYGDWSGLSHLTAINGRRNEALTWDDFWPEFRGLRFSFWGLFGWFNLLLPDWFYRAADLLTLGGLAGLVGATARIVRHAPCPAADQPAPRILALLLLWALLVALLLVYWISQATGSQGRLIFPGIIAYGILLPLGMDFWLRLLPRVGRRLAWGAILGTMLAMSLYALTALLPGAYNAPAPIAALPATAQAIDLFFDDPARPSAEPVAELVGVEVGAGRYRPGERVPVTLYWRTTQPTVENYQLFIQFLDENGREVANLTSHPGWGRNPTSFWRAGELYADPYQVQVTAPIGAQSPLLARVYTGLIDPARAETDNLPLPVRTGANGGAGGEVTPFVAAVELEDWPAPSPALETGPSGQPWQPLAATFGNVIRLAALYAPQEVSVTAGDALTVTLLWEAVGQPAADYTAFVHLLPDGSGESGVQVAGYDRAPAGDRFPTSRWRTGDHSRSSYPLALPPDLPAGDYTLWVGLYETGGDLRLPLTDAGGLAAGDGQVQAGSVRVSQSP